MAYNNPRKLARHDSACPAGQAGQTISSDEFAFRSRLFGQTPKAANTVLSPWPGPIWPACPRKPGAAGRRLPPVCRRPIDHPHAIHRLPIFLPGLPIQMSVSAVVMFIVLFRSLARLELALRRPLSFARTRALLPRCRRGSVWIRHGTEICEGSRSVHTVPPCCVNRFVPEASHDDEIQFGPSQRPQFQTVHGTRQMNIGNDKLDVVATYK